VSHRHGLVRYGDATIEVGPLGELDPEGCQQARPLGTVVLADLERPFEDGDPFGVDRPRTARAATLSWDESRFAGW
jgi:hypothetical protein